MAWICQDAAFQAGFALMNVFNVAAAVSSSVPAMDKGLPWLFWKSLNGLGGKGP